MKALVIH